MSRLLIDSLGWMGALLLLAAYFCVSFRKIAADSAGFQRMNAVGSLFLIVNTMFHHAYPSAFVNLVWIAIALMARLRIKGNHSYGKSEEQSISTH